MIKTPRTTGTTPRHVVIDVETTGLSPRYGHRVIEIGAVALEDGVVVGEFSTLVDAGVPVPYAVQAIHGITEEMLEGQPTPEQALPPFARFIRESVLVAHNAKFDIGFLNSEFARFHLNLNHPYVCTLEMSRRCFPRLPNHKLSTVFRHLFGKRYSEIESHRALGDARMVAAIFTHMREI